MLDYAPIASPWPDGLRADVTATAGALQHITLQPNPDAGGVRLSFEFDPGGVNLSDLRAALMAGETRVSEEWLRRWLV